MKLGFCLTELPPLLYNAGEGSAKPEMVMIDVPEDTLPQKLKDALDDSKDWIYINNIVRIRE